MCSFYHQNNIKPSNAPLLKTKKTTPKFIESITNQINIFNDQSIKNHMYRWMDSNKTENNIDL